MIFRLSCVSVPTSRPILGESHEGLRHLFRFRLRGTGTSEDLLCEWGAQSESEVVERHAARGAHPDRGTVHLVWSSQASRVTG